MSLIHNDPTLNKKLVEILDDIIEKGNWENTLFLQATGKKLRDFRERLKNELEFPRETENIEPTLIHRYSQKSKSAKSIEKNQLAFILIYCSEGNALKQWENVINSLATHSMTRPIYKNEADVQSVIKHKSNKQNDGYIALAISEKDISEPFNNKSPVDRHGNELIVLKEGAVRPENIEYFIHLDKYYIIQNKKLIRVEN